MPIVDDPGRPPSGRLLLDADGERVGRYDHVEVDADVYADVFERAPGVTVEHAAQAVLADLRGIQVVADHDLGRALLAAGGRALRHAHMLSRPNPQGALPPDPRGLRLTPVDRPAADLVDAFRAAYPPGHVDHHDDPPERSLATLNNPMGGRTAGPLLPISGLAVSEQDGRVVGALLAGAFPGDPPLNGPWIIEVFRDPAHPGTGRALLERALALAGREGLVTLGLVVTEGNPARRLYERLGFALAQTTLVVEL
jgi:GNAT superfamily N-acetyltransferase